MTVVISDASVGNSNGSGNSSGKLPLPGIPQQYPNIVIELGSAIDLAEWPLSPAESYAAAMYLLVPNLLAFGTAKHASRRYFRQKSFHFLSVLEASRLASS